MRGVPISTDTSHDALPAVASGAKGAAFFQVSPTINAIAAAAARAGPKKRTPT